MKIKAIAPYFGSKRTLAKDIVSQLGPHQVYWEPFCGSMAVLLAKPRCRMETVNDLNNDIVNLAQVLRHDVDGPKLYRRLRRFLAAETELLTARTRLHEKPIGCIPDLERAEAYFVNSWLSMNGTAGTAAGLNGRRGISRRFSSAGGAPAVRFTAAIASIPQWRDRLRHVFVLNSDGIELCERIEDKNGVVIYADPPYIEKGDEYLHDFKPEDHARLAEVLSRFRKTRVVVSYYDHPKVMELYHGWTVVRMTMAKLLGNQGGSKGAVEAPEVLLINGPAAPSEETQATLFAGE